MGTKWKIVEIKNVSREISYKVGYLRVSLDLPFNLEIHRSKNVKLKIFNLSTFSALFCEYPAIYEVQVTLEWPTLYKISRTTFLAPTIFHLGPIDREIFAKESPKREEETNISIFTYFN